MAASTATVPDSSASHVKIVHCVVRYLPYGEGLTEEQQASKQAAAAAAVLGFGSFQEGTG